MKHPVSNIYVGFYTLPYEDNQINKKPEIPVRLNKFIYIFNKKSCECCRSNKRSYCPETRFGIVKSKVNIIQKIIDNIKTVMYRISLS